MSEQMLKGIVSAYETVQQGRGHSVNINVFKDIVKDMVKQYGYSDTVLQKLTIVLGGPTQPVTLLGDDGEVLYVLPAIYDSTQTLDFSDVSIDIDKKREEHFQGSGRPLDKVIGLPEPTNTSLWGAFFKEIKEELEEENEPKLTTGSSDDLYDESDDAEIED